MPTQFHIAVLHPTLAYQGGAELSVVWLVNELVARSHKVTLITGSTDGPLVESLAPQVEVICLERSVDPSDWRSLPETVVSRLREVDLINPHNYPSYLWLSGIHHSLPPVVHFCQEPPQGLYAHMTQHHFLGRPWSPDTGLLSLMSQLKLKVRTWGSRLRGLYKLNEDAVRRCDLILANSRFTASNVERVYGQSAAVCHLGIPPYLSKLETQNEDKGPRGQILIPGRLSAIKNCGTVLKAMSFLREHSPDLLDPLGTTIIGDGWQHGFLEKQARTSKLEDYVQIKNPVSHQEMSKLYAQHQLVLYIPFDEPFGLVAVEAMAAKRPVIGSDQGGIPETILDRETGLHVNPANVTEVASAIEDLLADPDKCDAFGLSGYKRYQEMFTVSHFADRFLALVKPLIRDNIRE